MIAGVFEIVDFELAGAVALVPRLAGIVFRFDRRAVLLVRARAAGRNSGPEIIELVAMKADALAGLEANVPHPHAIVLRQQGCADAAVLLVFLEFLGDRAGPRRLRAIGLLCLHAEGHGVLPCCGGYDRPERNGEEAS